MSSSTTPSNRLTLDEMQHVLQIIEPAENTPILAIGSTNGEPQLAPVHEEVNNIEAEQDMKEFEFDLDPEAQLAAGYDSHPDDYHEVLPEGHEKHEENDDIDPDVDDPDNKCGRLVGEILSAVLSCPSTFCEPPYVELTINGQVSKLVLYRNTERVARRGSSSN